MAAISWNVARSPSSALKTRLAKSISMNPVERQDAPIRVPKNSNRLRSSGSFAAAGLGSHRSIESSPSPNPKTQLGVLTRRDTDTGASFGGSKRSWHRTLIELRYQPPVSCMSVIMTAAPPPCSRTFQSCIALPELRDDVRVCFECIWRKKSSKTPTPCFSPGSGTVMFTDGTLLLPTVRVSAYAMIFSFAPGRRRPLLTQRRCAT